MRVPAKKVVTNSKSSCTKCKQSEKSVNEETKIVLKKLSRETFGSSSSQAVMAVPIDKVPDYLGHLVLTEEGACISSGGDLENSEEMAAKMLHIVHTATRIPFSSSLKEKVKKISVIWDSCMFVFTVHNHKIYVSKRKYVPQEPVNA